MMRTTMPPPRRLPELTPLDAGRTFVMGPGSRRRLVLAGDQPAPVANGAVTVVPFGDSHRDNASGGGTPVDGTAERAEESRSVFEVTAVGRGSGAVRAGALVWTFEVRGAASADQTRDDSQTRDDTDAGWGERSGGHSRSWWEEQRPPHW